MSFPSCRHELIVMAVLQDHLRKGTEDFSSALMPTTSRAYSLPDFEVGLRLTCTAAVCPRFRSQQQRTPWYTARHHHGAGVVGTCEGVNGEN